MCSSPGNTPNTPEITTTHAGRKGLDKTPTQSIRGSHSLFCEGGREWFPPPFRGGLEGENSSGREGIGSNIIVYFMLI